MRIRSGRLPSEIKLEGEAPTGDGEEPTEEINRLRRERADLRDRDRRHSRGDSGRDNFQVDGHGISAIRWGDPGLILTPRCPEDCDRALAFDDGAQCVKALEPDLWTAWLRVREQIAEADEDAETLGMTWWRICRTGGRDWDYEATPVQA